MHILNFSISYSIFLNGDLDRGGAIDYNILLYLFYLSLFPAFGKEVTRIFRAVHYKQESSRLVLWLNLQNRIFKKDRTIMIYKKV